MHISWHGQFTLRLQTKDVVVIVDPYSPAVGLPAFRAKADVVTLTNPTDATMSHLSGIQGEPLVLDGPGEYTVKGLTLHALGWLSQAGQERNIQRFNIEGMTLVHVGALDRDLTPEELQELEKSDIDILFVPVGGGSALTTKQAIQLVTTLEPRLVIPIHFQLPQLAEKLSSVEQFAKEMGANLKQAEKKLLVRSNRLPQEEMETVILMP